VKESIFPGTTSLLVEFFVRKVSDGLPFTGLLYNSAGLTAYYYRPDTGAVAITLATMTLGTWATGGLILVDDTNMPGIVQLGLPDATIAAGARKCVIILKGVTDMEQVNIELSLNAEVNVRQMNDVPVIGAGILANKWRG